MVDIDAYIFGGVIVIGIASSFISYYLNKKRSDSISKIARDMGFSYEENAAADMGFLNIIGKFTGNSENYKPIEEFLPDSEILRWGSSRSIGNLISGKKHGRDIFAFDYCYTIHSGRSSYQHCQTVVVSRLHSNVPPFVLGPEGFLEKLGDLVMKHDIDFENYPEFSKKYYLKGQDKDAVKKTFSPDLIREIEKMPKKITLESDGKLIAFFIPRKKAKPEELPSQIEEASRIFDLVDPAKKEF